MVYTETIITTHQEVLFELNRKIPVQLDLNREITVQLQKHFMHNSLLYPVDACRGFPVELTP